MFKKGSDFPHRYRAQARSRKEVIKIADKVKVEQNFDTYVIEIK